MTEFPCQHYGQAYSERTLCTLNWLRLNLCGMNLMDTAKIGSMAVILIRDSYSEDYAQELAEDNGAISSSDASWPNTCVDWKQAARELQMDYTVYGV